MPFSVNDLVWLAPGAGRPWNESGAAVVTKVKGDGTYTVRLHGPAWNNRTANTTEDRLTRRDPSEVVRSYEGGRRKSCRRKSRKNRRRSRRN
jgi:hypothetical protein